MVSSYLALPRSDHLKQLLHTIAKLKKNHNWELVFDPTSNLEIKMNSFERKDWACSATEFGNIAEIFPLNFPMSRDHQGFFSLLFHVDADYAVDTINK